MSGFPSTQADRAAHGQEERRYAAGRRGRPTTPVEDRWASGVGGSDGVGVAVVRVLVFGAGGRARRGLREDDGRRGSDTRSCPSKRRGPAPVALAGAAPNVPTGTCRPLLGHPERCGVAPVAVAGATPFTSDRGLSSSQSSIRSTKATEVAISVEMIEHRRAERCSRARAARASGPRRVAQTGSVRANPCGSAVSLRGRFGRQRSDQRVVTHGVRPGMRRAPSLAL